MSLRYLVPFFNFCLQFTSLVIFFMFKEQLLKILLQQCVIFPPRESKVMKLYDKNAINIKAKLENIFIITIFNVFLLGFIKEIFIRKKQKWL